MKKAVNVIVGIIKVLIVLALCFVVIYVGLTTLDTDIENSFNINKGYFGVNPSWLSDANSTVIDEIYNMREENGDFLTAYNIYLEACKKLMLVPAYGIRAKCDIDVSAIGIDLTCSSNRTEQYKVAGVPELNANQQVYSSYVNTIYISDVVGLDHTLAGVLKSAIQFATRGYSDGTTDYKQDGKILAMDGDDEIIEWDAKFGLEDQTYKRRYEDDDIRDKCNFVVNEDTILPDSIVIDRDYDEEEGMYLYNVKMDLDCSNSDEGSAAYYEVAAIKDLLGKNMESLEYSQLRIEMSLYSNGYMIKWDTVQEWTLKYNLLFLSVEGTALNKKTEVFSYKEAECEVFDFTTEG